MASGPPAWAMIDCKPSVSSEPDNATTSAACETSAGMPIRVSLDTRKLCFPTPMRGVGPSTWQADVVIPFPEQRCVCWVDYSKGMLLYRVFDEFPVPMFHQLPATDLKARLRRHCLREHRRTVCVSQGKLRFVDADYDADPQQTSGFTVSKWTFRMSPQECTLPHSWSWEEDGDALQVDRLWSLPQYREKHLPLWIPEFPVVSKQDHHMVHFLMQDPETFTPASLITIDMRTMELLSYMPYTNAQKDGSLKDICMYTAFLSIELPKCHKLLSEGSVLVHHA
ncbi:hypothetical protein ACQ4PT_032476 [Festuca glaucescens]